MSIPARYAKTANTISPTTEPSRPVTWALTEREERPPPARPPRLELLKSEVHCAES